MYVMIPPILLKIMILFYQNQCRFFTTIYAVTSPIMIINTQITTHNLILNPVSLSRVIIYFSI